MLIREKYLSKIRPFYDEDLIKVITGIRRSGKSTLLNQIVEELKTTGVKERQIIYINFEYEDYGFIKNNVDLNKYIKNNIVNNEKYYLFFDEIQNVNKWEKAINSFKASMNVSIFITGSNSDLLSGELATHLSGRYVSFKVYPFSFKEVYELKKGQVENLTELFDDYILWGGLPQRFRFKNETEKRTYLSDIYDSIILNDIVKRFKIKDIDLLNRIVEYIITTPSQTFSAESLISYFQKDDRIVTKETLYNYLEYMCKAMLINKVDRYDVRGKRILIGKYKYYLTDLGLGQIINESKKKQMGAYLENIAYNELLIRGYEVKVGSLENGEIDFIATKQGKIEYYQICYVLSDENVINREFGAYDNIKDNFKKYVISTDTFDFSQEGIIHKNFIKWLLEDDDK